MREHVFIVGGSSGIGLATAELLSGDRYQVTIASRDQERLRSASARLGDGVGTIVFDAADPNSIAAGFAAVSPIDHLVLALGSSKGGGDFSSVKMDQIRAGFEEKVFPHISCAQQALPFLARSGSITFVSAVTAHAAMPGTAGLGAANAAIAALVPTLAAELRPLRVNGVSPGVIDTAWWDFLPDADKKAVHASYAEKTPVGRVGTAYDIAQTIEYLISCTFMNGRTLICDGGLSLLS